MFGRFAPLIRNIVRVGAGVAMGASVTPDQMIDAVTDIAVPAGANTEQIIAGFIAWALIEIWYLIAKRFGWKT